MVDDTLPMQDTNERVVNGLASKSEAMSSNIVAPVPAPLAQQQQQPPQAQHLPSQLEQDLVLDGSGKAVSSPRLLQTSPRAAQLQQTGDASSVTSDGSQDQGGILRQHGPPRRTYSSVDVDAAKQAAMSALAGLDMSTTKANLDASKAAAATARANGEVPAHVRKSNLRSVSCRQLGVGSSSTASGVGKSVAFDEAAKSRPADGTRSTVQWRGSTSTAESGQPRRTTRAPASRCISLPHVLQGRAGMANRLAATYAQDAALQQQLQLLNGSTAHAAQPFAAGFNQLQAAPQMDVMSMYQLQQAGTGSAAAGGQLLSQRSLNAGTVLSTMDDSMLQLRSGGLLVAAQQQQQQQAPMGANWPAGGQQQAQRVSWAPGPAQVAQHAMAPPGATLGNQQLHQLVQLQGGAQNVAAAAAVASGSNEALWLQNPAASTALQLQGSRPQGLLMPTANQAGVAAGGIPALQGTSNMLGAQLQQAQGRQAGLQAAAGSNPASAGTTFTALLDQYQQVSWNVLAAAQGEASLRDQLLTELVLQLTMLHTLSGVLKSTLAPSEALNDFSYLGGAARRHMATFTRLSQSGNIAVQLLAMIAPIACRHLGSAEIMEAAFLVLDTLALANRDVATVVTQQRLTALNNLVMPLPVDQLLQQQTLGLAWITNMAAAVSRNKQLLESLAAEQPGAAQPAVSAALLQSQGVGGGVLPLGGLPLASQPMMLSPTGAGTPSLSPTGKTPLATYFEETAPNLVSPGTAAAPGTAGLPGVGGLAAAVPGRSAGVNNLSLAGPSPLTVEGLLPDSLTRLSLGTQPGASDEASALAGLGNLALGVTPGQVPGQAAGASSSAAVGGGVLPNSGPFSPLNGGLSLFGDSTLLVPSSSAGSGPSSTGAPTGLVGV